MEFGLSAEMKQEADFERRRSTDSRKLAMASGCSNSGRLRSRRSPCVDNQVDHLPRKWFPAKIDHHRHFAINLVPLRAEIPLHRE